MQIWGFQSCKYVFPEEKKVCFIAQGIYLCFIEEST